MRLSSGTSKIQGLLSLVAGFKFSLLLTLMLLSLSLMAGGAYAANYYIAPTGSGRDTNNGASSSSPWATFAHAASVLQPGDTLYLLDGLYNANQNQGDYYTIINLPYVSGTSGNPITITALNKGNAQLTCGVRDGRHWAILTLGSYITIKNLKIYDCDIGIYYDTSSTSTNVTMYGNIIHDVTSPITTNDNCNYLTVDSNIVYNFGISGNDQSHGIYGRGISGTIINNLVYGNMGRGWSIHVGSYGVSPSGLWKIINNTLVGSNNRVHNECIALYANDFSALYMFNNICTGATTAMVLDTGSWTSGMYAEYNLMDSASTVCSSDSGSCSAATGTNVNHNLSKTSAGFANTSAGNYSLAAGSAAINAGTSLYAPAYDIIGTTRPQGGSYDIGAYEYASPVKLNHLHK